MSNIDNNQNSTTTKALLDNYTEQFKEHMKNQIEDNMVFQTFFKKSKILSVSNNFVLISFDLKNVEYYDKYKQYYSKQINNAIKEIFGEQFSYKVQNIQDFKQEKIKEENKQIIKIPEPIIKDKTINNFLYNSINDEFTINNFVKSEFNNESTKISLNLIEKNTNISLVFLTSNSGLGKTHLLHAIANEIKKEKRSFVYFNPAIFLRDIVNLLKENNNDIITKLLEYYSNVDLVLFDDFETIAEGNKIATKNFIFQIIDTRLQNKKPTIIASQKEINSLKEVLDEKLITRLSSGFITKINEPKKEDLMKILEFLLTENGINISNINEKSKNYIIRNHSKNISSLIGAVKRIDFYKEEINNSNNTEEIIYSIFKDLVKEIDEILPENILKTIAKHYRINTKDILGKTREAKVVVARHIAMNIFKELLDWSSVEIGKYFYRDHSTVLNAFKKHKQNQINNKDNEFEIIKNKILGIN